MKTKNIWFVCRRNETKGQINSLAISSLFLKCYGYILFGMRSLHCCFTFIYNFLLFSDVEDRSYDFVVVTSYCCFMRRRFNSGTL